MVASQVKVVKIIEALILLCFVVFALRLLYLGRYDVSRLEEVEKEVGRVEKIAPLRGEIRSSDGCVLARTENVKTIIVNPERFCNIDLQTRNEYLQRVAGLFKMDAQESREFYQKALLFYKPATPTNGAILKDKNGKVYAYTNGSLVYAKTNSLGNIITNKYVQFRKNVPVEEWARIKACIATNAVPSKKEMQTNARYKGYKRVDYLALGTQTVYAEDDFLRVHPNGKFMSHVVGYTQEIDKPVKSISSIMETEEDGWSSSVRMINGFDGVEKFCNTELKGVWGERKKTVRRKGSKVTEITSERSYDIPVQNGLNVVLTLDSVIQNIVEKTLDKILEKHSPTYASCIVLEPQSGRILAYAISPDYNPDKLSDTDPKTWKNRIIQDLLEPGSTFKMVTFAAAINEKRFTGNSRINCSFWKREWGKAPTDHGKKYGVLELDEVMAKSSNPGFGQVGWALGADTMNKYIRDFGYRNKTGIMLPGEQSHTNNAIKPKQDLLSVSRVPFGQGIAVTQLQTTMAIGAIANKGKLMRPQIIDHLEDENGRCVVEFYPEEVRQVVTEQSAAATVKALKRVVATGGTGVSAALDFYTVAGKTGTAQKAVQTPAGQKPLGYIKGKGAKYTASFGGFFPADNPSVVITIIVDEPTKGGYYAAQVVAPYFKEIATQIAAYRMIPPDKVDQKQ